MKITLSTNNDTKVVEVKDIFKGSSIQVKSLKESGIVGKAIEDGKTAKENSRKKVIFAYKNNGGDWAMADDTILSIDALDGAPGVYSARWAGEYATTDDITKYTLDKLRGKTNRGATFETVVVVKSPDGEEYVFEGRCRGRIAEIARTKARPQMPYSPIFIPDGFEVSLAEMTIPEENAISHRGQAFRQALDFLVLAAHR
jgi:XTP/dITP diphosphohydrolase